MYNNIYKIYINAGAICRLMCSFKSAVRLLGRPGRDHRSWWLPGSANSISHEDSGGASNPVGRLRDVLQS